MAVRGRVDSQPLTARVGNHYYSYAAGYQQSVKVNDPSSNCYEPQPRFHHCAALVDNKWFVIGGTPSTLSLIQEYDIASESWHQHESHGDIPSAACGIACTSHNGRIYTFGGCTLCDRKYTNDLSELDMKSMVWKTLQSVQSPSSPILKQDAAMTTLHNTLVTFGGYGTYLERMKQSKARYDFKEKSQAEVWTNELFCYNLDGSEWQDIGLFCLLSV